MQGHGVNSSLWKSHRIDTKLRNENATIPHRKYTLLFLKCIFPIRCATVYIWECSITYLFSSLTFKYNFVLNYIKELC